MNLNFDYQFDVYKFHEVGFNVGILPTEFITEAKKIIKSTKFNTGAPPPYSADWMSIPGGLALETHKLEDFGYEESLRDLYCYNNSPYYIKSFANEVLDLNFFIPLRKSLVTIQAADTYWTRSVRPFTYGLWNGAENLEWHNDNYDNSYMVLLMYFNDYSEWKAEWDGQICFGIEQEDGNIKEIHKHYPTDGTFVCINNYNPLMKHRAVSNKNNTNRYTFNVKCRIH
jgi:hypothetical protein